MGLVLFVAAGCTSRGSNANQESESKAPGVANDPSEHYFDGAKYCVQTFLQGPALRQPLHFWNQVTESDQSLHSKNDVKRIAGEVGLIVFQNERWLATGEDRKFFAESHKSDDPKVIVRAIRDGFAEQTVTNHVTRSDEEGWRSGATFFAQGGTPWGLLIYKPPVTRVGAENINGYETMKYTVDTTHQSRPEKSAGFLGQLKGLQHHRYGVGPQKCRLHLAIQN